MIIFTSNTDATRKTEIPTEWTNCYNRPFIKVSNSQKLYEKEPNLTNHQRNEKLKLQGDIYHYTITRMVKMSKIKTSQQVRGNWGPHALSNSVSWHTYFKNRGGSNC